MHAAFFHNDRWYDEQPLVLGPMDHAMWMATVVFDGARIFDGLAPDLDQHCQRVVDSAEKMLLQPTKTAEEIEALVHEAYRRLPAEGAFYVRPMFYAMRGFVVPEADSTEFLLVVYEAPMPEPRGMSVMLSSCRRPGRDQGPVDAKASCNYPIGQRALVEAAGKGFDNALMLDANGNVAELATANIWLAKDGVAKTPAWNGVFLNGITRQRVKKLLEADGIEVEETTLRARDFEEADEVFSTGNYGKVLPVSRFMDRPLQPGPVYSRARQLYFDYARTQPMKR